MTRFARRRRRGGIDRAGGGRRRAARLRCGVVGVAVHADRRGADDRARPRVRLRHHRARRGGDHPRPPHHRRHRRDLVPRHPARREPAVPVGSHRRPPAVAAGRLRRPQRAPADPRGDEQGGHRRRAHRGDRRPGLRGGAARLLDRRIATASPGTARSSPTPTISGTPRPPGRARRRHRGPAVRRRHRRHHGGRVHRRHRGRRPSRRRLRHRGQRLRTDHGPRPGGGGHRRGDAGHGRARGPRRSIGETVTAVGADGEPVEPTVVGEALFPWSPTTPTTTPADYPRRLRAPLERGGRVPLPPRPPGRGGPRGRRRTAPQPRIDGTPPGRRRWAACPRSTATRGPSPSCSA